MKGAMERLTWSCLSKEKLFLYKLFPWSNVIHWVQLDCELRLIVVWDYNVWFHCVIPTLCTVDVVVIVVPCLSEWTELEDLGVFVLLFRGLPAYGVDLEPPLRNHCLEPVV